MTEWVRQALLAVIERYQRGGGGRRYFGVVCNFTPSCSEYARQAIADRGPRQGLRLAWHRIRRCTARDQPHTIHDPYPARDDRRA